MDELIEKLNRNFGDKFSQLKLLDVVYNRASSVCTVCFLYPQNEEDVSTEDRKTILNFVKDFFALSCEIKIKFKKSFLDASLVNKEVKNYFEAQHKALLPYIKEENISSLSKNLDVEVVITLNDDVLSIIDENLIRQHLIAYLNKKFIANFSVVFKESKEKLPEHIDAPDIINTSTNSVARYEVMPIKKVFGNDIIPKPEYIKNITSPKSAVILAGTVSNMIKKTFIIKKGKRQGQEKSYYSFFLKDNSGQIECIYFCPKSNEKAMDALSQNTSMLMFLFVGDVQKGLSDKLTYYVRKMSICQLVKQKEVKQEIQVDPLLNHKQIVFPQILETFSQDTLFGQQKIYNDTILNNEIVVFDLETTGLNTESCEITEIGAVKIVNGQIKDRFASFVKTQNPIPAEVAKLTHITDEMLCDAPSVDDVVIDFYNYTRGCIISGYNIVDFDLKIIKRFGQKLGLKFDNIVLDALIMARQGNLRLQNYKLGTVVKALGIQLVDAHRAYNDAQATAMVLLELSKLKK